MPPPPPHTVQKWFAIALIGAFGQTSNSSTATETTHLLRKKINLTRRYMNMNLVCYFIENCAPSKFKIQIPNTVGAFSDETERSSEVFDIKKWHKSFEKKHGVGYLNADPK